MASGISHAVLNAVVRVLSSAANNLQVRLLLLADDADPVRYCIMTTRSRVASVGDWTVEPVVLPKVVTRADYTIPETAAAFTPTKVYVVGNVGDYQCPTEAALEAILNTEAEHPVLADVTIGTYEIPPELQVEYEPGEEISARITVEASDETV